MTSVNIISAVGESVVVCVLIGTGIVYALWLQPFLENRKLVTWAGVLYIAISMSIHVTPEWFPNYIVFGLADMSALPIIYWGEKRNLQQKVFLCGIFMVVRYAGIAVAIEIDWYVSDFIGMIEIFKTDVDAIVIEYVVQRFLYLFLTMTLLYLAVKVFHTVFIRKNENLNWKEVGLLLAPAVPVFFARYAQKQFFELWNRGIENGMIKENLHGNIVWLSFYFTAYLVVLIVVWLYQDNKNRAEEMREMLLIKSQQADLKTYMEQLRKLYEEQRSLRHDIGNHIQTMERLMASQKSEDAVKYLEKLKREREEITPSIKTGNPVLDVIFADKMERAKERGIEFVSDFHFPEDSGIEAYDMSIILNNALNNCLENVNGNEPYIHVSSHRKKSVMLIIVKNSFHGKLKFRRDSDIPETTKTGEEHGIGLKNIRRIAKMYQGELSFEQTADEVVLTVMLQVG